MAVQNSNVSLIAGSTSPRRLRPSYCVLCVSREACRGAERLQSSGDRVRQRRGVRLGSVGRLMSAQAQHQTRRQAATPNATHLGR